MVAPTLSSALSGALLLMGSLPLAAAEFNISSRDDIVKSSKKLATDLMTFYKGDEFAKVPGLLPGPPTDGPGDYYFIDSAGFWGAYIDYQHWTGDDSFQDSIVRGLAHQTGPNDDYMPPNHTAMLGNDDQCWWGSLAMLAAEYQLPNAEGKVAWIEIAKNVWDTMAHPSRQDDKCGGGLRWMIPPTNAGYDFKQTAANGCFLNLSARLARFTGNETYAEHAEKTWKWLSDVGLVTDTGVVYEGANVDDDCGSPSKALWSANAAIITQGAAFMYNYTRGSTLWHDRTHTLITRTISLFFPYGIAYEESCEKKKGSCTSTSLFYKGYAHRWLAAATQVAPFLSDLVLPVFNLSATAAAKQCREGDDGVEVCGFYWSSGEFVDPEDNRHTTGVGERTSVLAAISSLLVDGAEPPFHETDKDFSFVDDGKASSTTSASGTGSGSGSGSAPGSTSTADADESAAGGYLRADVRVSMVAGVLALFAWAL